MSTTLLSEPVRAHDEEHGVSPRDSDASLPSNTSQHVAGGTAGGAASGAGFMGSNEQLVTENEKAAELTKWQRYKAHWKRRWPIYLVVNVILLAIILPVFFVVIIPFIMQKVVDGGKLPVYEGLIQAVTNDRVALNLSTQFPGLAGLRTDIDAMNVSLYNEDHNGFNTPYVIFPIARQSYKGNTNVSVTTVATGISNRTELEYWLSQLLVRDDWELDLNAETHVHLGALKGKVKINKRLPIKGLNNFGVMQITKTNLQAPVGDDGANLQGRLTLNNTSPLIVDIGNLTLNAQSGNLTIGEFNVNNFVSPPGVKDMNFFGKLSLGVLVKNILQVVRDQKRSITKGVLGIKMVGKSVIVNNEHMTYVEKALQAGDLNAEVPLSALLGGVVTGVKNGDLQLPALLSEVVDDMPGNTQQLKSILNKWGFTSSK